MPRLVVVDDEPHTRRSLTRAISSMSYDVEAASSGEQALSLLKAEPRDVMVLDLSMPDMSGTELMDRALELCPNLLIIILVEQATLETAIAGVKRQVVDYLVKDASAEKVAGAVTAALREQSRKVQERVLVRYLSDIMDTAAQPVSTVSSPAVPQATPPYYMHVPPLSLNVRMGTVVVNGDAGRTANLTRSEAGLLAALIDQAGKVLSARELASAMQGYDPGEQAGRSAVSHCIHRLRRKIEADPSKPRLIRTVRGRGYVFLSSDR